MPATRLSDEQAQANPGTRIAFDSQKQAWFPVNGHIPEGAVLATLKTPCVYDKAVGMRSRAIAFEFEHGESDDATPPAEQAEEADDASDE